MLNPGIIVSCQAPLNSGLDTYVLCQMAKAVVESGCVGLRVNLTVATALNEMNSMIKVPIIGLTKEYHDGIVMITPSLEYAKELENQGCEYIATDGTGRWGYEEIEKMIKEEIKVIADVETVDQGFKCEELGCYGITTALSGYTKVKEHTFFENPDLDLVKKLTNVCSIPVIAEGRYWSTNQIINAVRAGANNVCIGAAITRPDLITKKYVEVFNGV